MLNVRDNLFKGFLKVEHLIIMPAKNLKILNVKDKKKDKKWLSNFEE